MVQPEVELGFFKPSLRDIDGTNIYSFKLKTFYGFAFG